MISILFGLISGTVTGLGMGGGTVLILLLSNFMGLDQHIAQATNLIFFIPTSIATIIINLKNKNINKKLAVYISIFGVIGAIFGAKLAEKISSNMLRKYFAIFILIIGLIECYRLFKENKYSKKRHNMN